MKSRSGGQKSSANPAANRDQMNTPANHDEDEDQGDVFLDENDIVLEINVDDEGVVQMGSYGPPLSLSLYICVFVISLSLSLCIQIFRMQKMQMMMRKMLV